MIPYAVEENHQGPGPLASKPRDRAQEHNARVLLDMLQPNTHYRFITWQWGGKTVTQLYAKRISLRWGVLSVVGSVRKQGANENPLVIDLWDDRRWNVPTGLNRRVQVWSNKKLVWEGKL